MAKTIRDKIAGDVEFATSTQQMTLATPDETYETITADILARSETQHPRAVAVLADYYGISADAMTAARIRNARPPYRPSYAGR